LFEILKTVIAFIVIFGVLVFVHEFGHFIVAKRSGIKVLEFAFGIGPKLFGFQGKETLYSIRILPLGGFCRFLSVEEVEEGEEGDQVSREELLARSFESKSIWKRMAVIVAGPLMNFILGAVLFVVAFAFFGVAVADNQNLIGQVSLGKPAATAGLAAGDRIIAINRTETPDWNSVTQQIHTNPGEKMSFTVEKADTKQIVTIEITPAYDQELGKGLIGIAPSYTMQKVSVLKSIQYGFLQTVEFTRQLVLYLIHMITGEAPVELSGPIGVAQVIGEGVKQGMSSLFTLAAVLSINFGVLNILPLPALDGGQLAVMTFEGIRRKPLSIEKKGWIQLTGFALLIALMIAVTYQDILRIITK